eukprot:scaffold2512_cov120-Cylindrotheca_fusiformis.AAC.2
MEANIKTAWDNSSRRVQHFVFFFCFGGSTVLQTQATFEVGQDECSITITTTDFMDITLSEKANLRMKHQWQDPSSTTR